MNLEQSKYAIAFIAATLTASSGVRAQVGDVDIGPEILTTVNPTIEGSSASATATNGDNIIETGAATAVGGDAVIESDAINNRNELLATGGSSNQSQTANTGDVIDNSVQTFRSGAMTGAPNMGGLFLPDACMDGLQLSVGGGTPFNGSGGIGFTFVDPAGVAFNDGLSLKQFMALSGDDRGQYIDDFSKGDREQLTCLMAVVDAQIDAQEHAYESQLAGQIHEERMQTAQFAHDFTMEKLRIAGEAYLRAVEHTCGHTEWRPDTDDHRENCDLVFDEYHQQFKLVENPYGTGRISVPEAIEIPTP